MAADFIDAHISYTDDTILCIWFAINDRFDLKAIFIQPEKHLQCARIGQGKQQKRGNKNSGESITPIRYNIIIHTYIIHT